MQHVHFGAGRLGLGLAVALSSKAGIYPTVFNRTTASQAIRQGDLISPARRNELLAERPRYLLQSLASSTLSASPKFLQTVELKSFVTYEDTRGPTPTHLKHFMEDEPYLVTCSVGNESGYAFPSHTVAKALAKRKEAGINHPIFLMTYENNIRVDFFASLIRERLIHSKSRKFFDSLPLHPVDSIADRICVGLSQAGTGDPKHTRLTVMCEPYHHVFVDAKAFRNTDLETALMPVKDCVEATRYLDLETMKKLWLLNGTHGLVALMAIYDDKKTLPQFFNDAPFDNKDKPASEYRNLPFKEASSKLRTIQGILREFGTGLRTELLLNHEERGQQFIDNYFSSSQEEEYREELIERFTRVQDVPGRIVHQFRPPTNDKPEQTSLFLKRFVPRIVPPMESYITAKGDAPTQSTRAVLRMLEMIEKGYYGVAASPSLPLTEKTR